MGFAQSQLGHYKEAGESFMHAIQAAKDSRDKQGLWQAYEGLAAVSFLEEDYNKAVEYYKLALSVLSSAGETEHTERIISKLANALECQVVNGRLSPLRVSSIKKNRDGRDAEDIDGQQKRIGKTRVRQEHHKLIARGIDGQQTPTESEQTESGDSFPSSGEEIRHRQNTPKEQKHRTATTEVDVHHEMIPRGHEAQAIGSSSEEEKTIRKKVRTKSRHFQKERKGEWGQSRQVENYYEHPVDEMRSSPLNSDMPRAHREALLASVQASTPPRQDPNETEVQHNKNSVQSRMCTIQ